MNSKLTIKNLLFATRINNKEINKICGGLPPRAPFIMVRPLYLDQDVNNTIKPHSSNTISLHAINNTPININFSRPTTST